MSVPEAQISPELARAGEMQERRRQARNLNLPTSDVDVKLSLRRMRQPICIFGEDAMARRERLREIVVKAYAEEGRAPVLVHPPEKKEEKGGENEVFYTHGSAELKAARLEMALYSIPRASARYVSSVHDFRGIG